MENRLPRALADLIGAANVVEKAAREHGPTIPLMINTADTIAADVAALTSQRDAHEAQRVALASQWEHLAQTVVIVRTFLTLGRDVLKPVFGTRYSSAYNVVGFSGSLMVPRNHEALIAMLLSFEGFYVANPAMESAGNGLTATRARELCDQLIAARARVNKGEAQVRDLRVKKDAAAEALCKRLRGLIAELKMRLDPADGRWLAFGFNMPAAKETPDTPENITAVQIDSNKGAVNWDRAPRAEYYHVRLKVNGVDEEPRLVGSPRDPNFMLEELPANATIELGISAINSGGESATTMVVITTR